MKNIIKKSITAVIIMALALTLAMPVTAQAKATPRLNKTKVTVSVKKSYQLKVIGISKKATWKSSNKKVATVSKNGKMTGNKKGSAVITAKVNKKTYKCKVTVTEPTLNKTKVTLTITKKKTKPAVQLKVKNVSAKNVKWTTSNKKVATVSKNGKVVAKKKGNAVITVKVKGSKTLRCKVTVKDNRKPVTKPNPNPTPAPSPKPPVECEHNWVKKTVTKMVCECGEIFYDEDARTLHNRQFVLQGLGGHSFSTDEETYYECSKCHKTK